MKRLGYICVAITFVLAVTAFALHLGGIKDGSAYVLIVCFFVLFLAMLIFLIHGSVRLWKGEVRLRPWDAFKRAVVLFLLFMVTMGIVSIALPSDAINWWAYVISSSLYVTFSSLHSTAYRKSI